MQSPSVDWSALLVHPQVVRLIELALDEDVTPGDVTTAAIFRAPQRVRGHIISRTPTVVCGMALAEHLLRRFDPDVRWQVCVADGTEASAATPVARFEADVRAVLA